MINFSELLWTSRRTTDQGRPRTTTVFPEPENGRRISAPRHTLIEESKLELNSRAALLLDSQSALADRLRLVRMRLRELRALTKLQSLVITSPLPGDGKSTITMCLATVLAEDRSPVLVIEADLYRPSLAATFGLTVRSGLAECLEAGLDPLAEFRQLSPMNWCLLQAGETQSNPTELLQSDVFAGLMRRVSPHFDWILVDTPPALPRTDALSVSRCVDGTLLVAQASRTPRGAVEKSLDVIGRKHVVGIILNSADALTRLYSGYYKSYLKR